MKPAPDTARGYLRPLLAGRKKAGYDRLLLLWLAAALWFWLWWFQPEHRTTGLPYWVATVALGWLFSLQLFFAAVLRQAKAPAGQPPDPDRVRVAMIVTKTPSEPFAVVRRTLQAMLAQDYPHDTWLADEDPSPETEDWCRRHGVRISTRRGRADYHRQEWPRRTRCKEGNLAFFYDSCGYEQYDFVSQLDADHVPEPGYLREIMRGFADPGVGYVSAPSICAANADGSWAARTRLHTEAAFHGVFQAGYCGALAPMCIGSHYAVRTRALREVGGLGPELAEDHSTTMLMNAGGWRGVHAIDAIATGDGPAGIADLCTQEFQWSRSLLTIFLRFSAGYLPRLPLRLKLLFAFCQLFYLFFASFMVLLFAMPVAALLMDFRYAEVTYPAFLGHILPQIAVLTFIAFRLRSDGLFRPKRARVISWEKAVFMGLQWPWVICGCAMAVRDRLFGGFVDFRITPKGEAAQAALPLRIVAVYAALALACFVPVLLAEEVQNAHGFYILTAINGVYYTVITAVIVYQHYRRAALARGAGLLADLAKAALVPLLLCLAVLTVQQRGLEGLYALSKGLEPLRLVSERYAVAGAGMGGPGTVILYYDPGWDVPARTTISKE